MDSLAGPQQRALWVVNVITALRGKGGYSEEEIAEKAGYRGAGHMRQELREWGFPSWFIEGDAPPKPSKPTKPKQHKRRARISGPVEELPPASNATPLFREKLEALAQDNEDLRYHKEKFQGGLFHQGALYDPIYYPRDKMSEEGWKQLCEIHNLDPDEAGYLDTSARTRILGGGTPAPQAPLPALIAAYVLTEGDVGPLLAALYPGTPSAEIMEQIKKRIEGKKGDDKLDGLKVVAALHKNRS